MNCYANLIFLTALSLTLSGCATGPSPTLSKYTDQQQKRCYTSLTFGEREEASRNVQAKAMIPIVGAFIGTKEALYQEYEKICKRKGVL